MLDTPALSKPLGFSLIELMVGIVIFAITLTLGISSYREWMQNTQIRNAAESISSGLQRARGEAIKRNANVAFILGANTDWQVSVVDAAGLPIVPPIETRSSNEGSKNVSHAVVPANATMVTFNNLGTVGVAPNQPLNADGTAPLRQILLDSTVLTPAASRELRVWIGNAAGVGSSIKVCDPNLATTPCP